MRGAEVIAVTWQENDQWATQWFISEIEAQLKVSWLQRRGLHPQVHRKVNSATTWEDIQRGNC